MRAAIIHTWRHRDFFGFNRGKHAVIEAAILATRVHLISPTEIVSEYKRLAPLVHKTGGRDEEQAFAILSHYVEEQTNFRAHKA
jgi:hypothetical protein